MYIRQIPAKQLVEGIFGALRDAGIADEGFTWNIATDAQNITFSVGSPSLNAVLQQPQMQAFKKIIDEHDFIVCTSFSLETPQAGKILVFQTQPDSLTGMFTVSQGGKLPRQLALLKALRTQFKVFSHAALLDKTQQEFVSIGLKQQEIAIAALEAQARRLHEFMEASAKEDRERMQAFRAELEKDFLARKAEIDKEHEARKAALEQERRSTEETFKRRQEEFDQKVKEFETQESKFVRRKLLKDFEAAIAEGQKPQLSEATEKKRMGVHGVVWAIELVAVAVLVASVYRFVNGETYDWRLAIPLTASFGTGISTAVYYLRWLDRLYREHADLEFTSSRYKADMLRASWVAELSAEMHALGDGATIPPQLIEALTRSLFQAKADGPSEHPMEQLISMVKRGNEVKLGKDGLTLKASDPKQ